MSVRVERRFSVDASPETVWAFLEDPTNRARAISIVDSFETAGETTIWHLKLPIPGLRRTLAVRTRPLERKSPEYVCFEGESSVFDVHGEHSIEEGEAGTIVNNRFDVTGRVPGVETFFKRRFEDEIVNLERELSAYIQAQ